MYICIYYDTIGLAFEEVLSRANVRRPYHYYCCYY